MAPVKAYAAETVARVDAIEASLDGTTAALAARLCAVEQSKADESELHRVSRVARKAEDAIEVRSRDGVVHTRSAPLHHTQM